MLKFSGIIKFNKNEQAVENWSDKLKLKQHHHVRLDAEFKLDCKVWLDFLDTERDLHKIVNRLMVDILGHLQTSEDIRFFSDASANKRLGMGCVLDSKWIWGKWEDGFIEKYEPSIEFLELHALCAGIFTWQEDEALVNCRINLFCDNTVVVGMINKMSSSCKRCMHLLRLLALNNLRFNRRISAKYIDTKSNFLADSLSRGQLEHFRRLGPHMNEQPDVISELVLPISKVWIN